MSYSLADLRAMSDEALIATHDRHAPNTVVGVNYYLEELRHRDFERASDAANRLARKVFFLTVTNTILASVAATAAIFALSR